MKKNILALILAFCLILPCAFIMSACDDGITDCAYLQFVPANEGEVVKYTSQMYADSGTAHVYLFESEAACAAGWENNYLLKISFNRGLGVDFDIDKKETFVAAIEGWYYMKIEIKKDYYYSSEDPTIPKKVYLNGEDITSKTIQEHTTKAPVEGSHALGTFWYDGVYYFEDFGLVKGNQSNFINTIEFK